MCSIVSSDSETLIGVRVRAAVDDLDIDLPKRQPLSLHVDRDITVELVRVEPTLEVSKRIGLTRPPKPFVAATAETSFSADRTATERLSRRAEEMAAFFAARATDAELTGDQLKSIFKPDDDLGKILRPMEESLLTAVNKVVGLLRWRFAFPGPPARPFKLEFSLDGTNWVDPWWGLSLPFFVAADAPPAKVREIAALIESGAEAPLAWELFYEALGLQSSSARAAFLLATTAAEVGIKEFGGRRSSSERWLLDEIPSPRMEMLVGSY